MTDRSSSESTYLDLIRRLAITDPPAHVFGGFADDALLDGRVTRPHGDLDVLVARGDLGAHFDRFRELGFSAFESLFEPVPGRTLVYGASDGHRQVELGVHDRRADGSVWFALPWDDETFSLTFPEDAFTHALGRIDGVPIRTVSPLAQYLLREAFLTTGVFGPPRPNDRALQTRFRDRLLLNVTDEELRPRLDRYME